MAYYKYRIFQDEKYMANVQDNIRDDPDYKKTKWGEMFGTHLRSMAWGVVAAVAFTALTGGVGLAALFTVKGLALAAVAAVAGIKAWSASKDEQAEMADVTARRTRHHLMAQQGTAVSQLQDISEQVPSTNWQKTVSDQRSAPSQNLRG